MLKIIQTPSPNFNERPLGIDTIIIHYTDMISSEAALAWLINPSSHVSAHYLINEGGQIYQIVKEEQRAWHAGESYWQGRTNLNDCSIGIELANPGHSNGYTPFPEVQINALIELCLKIKERWNIPPNRILGHSDIAPGRKQDPGHLFPWERLAQEGLGMWPVPREESQWGELTEMLLQFVYEIGPLAHILLAFQRHFQPHKMPREKKLMEMLSQLGYDITSPSHTLLAFQRHFQPHKLDGVADKETHTLLQGLLKSQEMLI
jgi:N-acetylmuramoyl-L-alanine amidase